MLILRNNNNFRRRTEQLALVYKSISLGISSEFYKLLGFFTLSLNDLNN